MDIENIGQSATTKNNSRIGEHSKYSIDVEKLKSILTEYINMPSAEYLNDWEGVTRKLQRKYKMVIGKRELGQLYRELLKSNSADYPFINDLYNTLIIRKVRSNSGIINVTVVFPGKSLKTCKYNCYFCPDQPGMPRSYLDNEDAIARAVEVEFDALRQIWSRLEALEDNGHEIDKIEIRSLGGTFSCIEHDETYGFLNKCVYAVNIYHHRHTPADKLPPMLSLREELDRNQYATVHIAGIGVETRPDEINADEIVRFREYGITRVELGYQHTNDSLLKRVNRGHGVKASRRANQLLKEYGFKIEAHIMADLPGATPEMDKECYEHILRDDPYLFPDYMKDYPCMDVSYTEIKKWRADGRWQPYADKTPDARDLRDVLIYRQSITPRWVRVNRIIRDFRPAREDNGYLGFDSNSLKANLAQLVKDEAEQKGIYCQCIRCSEIKNEKFAIDEIVYDVMEFEAAGATEYFISAYVKRTHRNLLLGFIRLRTSNFLESNSVIPELTGKTAMIRELHVYGKVLPVGKNTSSQSAQHLGIGKRLLAMAEDIAIKKNYEKIAVISGVGVRGYYEKRGYALEGTYMIKHFTPKVGCCGVYTNLGQVETKDVNYEHMYAWMNDIRVVFVIIIICIITHLFLAKFITTNS